MKNKQHGVQPGGEQPQDVTPEAVAPMGSRALPAEKGLPTQEAHAPRRAVVEEAEEAAPVAAPAATVTTGEKVKKWWPAILASLLVVALVAALVIYFNP